MPGCMRPWHSCFSRDCERISAGLFQRGRLEEHPSYRRASAGRRGRQDTRCKSRNNRCSESGRIFPAWMKEGPIASRSAISAISGTKTPHPPLPHAGGRARVGVAESGRLARVVIRRGDPGRVMTDCGEKSGIMPFSVGSYPSRVDRDFRLESWVCLVWARITG